MNKYNAYKDSGIEWIGEIPEHWIVDRFSFHFDFSRGLSITKQDLQKEGTPCVSYGEIHSKYGFDVDPIRDDLKCVENTYLETSEKSLLNKGDFIFADTSEDIDGSGNFTCLNSDIPTFAGYHTIITRLKTENNYRFLSYYFDSLEYRNQIRCEVSGIKVYSITQAILKNTEIIIPSPEEQTAIANYLDRKTAEIDELIADKKRLLELYDEEKTAIINDLVTGKKVWNGNAWTEPTEIKDSGIDWLGEIPEHWEVVNFNRYVFLRHGYQFRNFDFTNSGIKVIKITQLKANGELEINDVSYIDENRLDEFSDILIKDGDILMALTGGTIGKIIRAPQINEPLLQNYRVGNFFPNNNKLTKDYLFWVLSSDCILKQIFYDQRETGQPNIGKEDFGRMYFVLPKNKEEQQQIVNHIETEIARIDSKKAHTQQLIDLLTEYRTALISEVVTGKIKVTE